MKTTPLHESHKALGAKMGEFAGYDMPLYYPDGVLKEHEWVRAHAGLFDVSHMGQITVEGAQAAAFWERMTPSGFTKAKNGMARYTVLTNEQGGILDDLIVTRLTEDKFYAVINAGRKYQDLEWLRRNLPDGLKLEHLAEHALIALQGPSAEQVLFEVFGLDVKSLAYMTGQYADVDGTQAFISRLGYTGEDGFELSVPGDRARAIWDRMLVHAEVKPIGLAARDSLRLEMGYCLYGHDIDENVTPVEADLGWVIGKDNQSFIGATPVRAQMADGAGRKRTGFQLLDKGVAREGALVLDMEGREIGRVTSGSFSPTLKFSIGQGYIDAAHANAGEKIMVDVRGRRIPAEIAPMPFVEPKTKAKAAKK